MKKEADGFTLVELLVVISIISMLMSMLMPALNRAREMGKQVDCLSNLRQLTLAWTMYAMDNDDKLCSPDTLWYRDNYGFSYYEDIDLPHWVADGPDGMFYDINFIGGTNIAIEDGVLWSYMQTLKLYKCKSDSSDRLRSYSISNTMGGKYRSGYSKGQPFKTLTEITSPTNKMVLVGASTSTRSWISRSYFPFYDIDTPNPFWGVPAIDGGPAGNWFSDHRITARHDGGVNMSFADGHCEYWKWKDPRTVKLATGELSLMDDVNNDNPDIPRLIEALEGRR